MGLWDSIKETTQKATSSISEVASSTSKVVVEKMSGTGTAVAQAASKAGKAVSEKMSEAGSAVAQTASKTGKAVSSAASATIEKVTSMSRSVYDNMCEFAAKKIKSMLRGMDLQSTIDALNKLHDEKGTDVSALVKFINQLKTFSEDGEE